MSEPIIWLSIASGGAAGAILRGAIYRAVERWSEREAERGRPSEFGAARSTLLVNVLGSFALGWVIGRVGMPSAGLVEPFLAFWVTGLCGAVTTFSTLCADTMTMARSHGHRHAAIVILANALFGIAALALGLGVGG